MRKTTMLLAAGGLAATAGYGGYIKTMPADPNFTDKIKTALSCAGNPINSDGVTRDNTKVYRRAVSGVITISHTMAQMPDGSVLFCKDGAKSSVCTIESADGGFDGIPEGTFQMLDNGQEVPGLQKGVNQHQRGIRAMAEACLKGEPNLVNQN